MSELRLSGCTPEPLMNYLKALGIFRLVAEQSDPEASLSWTNGVATLHSRLSREDLITFFMNEYRPTPILAPWNGGSGFYGGGSAPVEAIAKSTMPRLKLYRDTIKQVREIVPKQKPKDDEKRSLLAMSRGQLADEVVAWLDTCFVLSEDGVRFFPLLGTGGNDGRLDFTNNFMQRLAEVISFEGGDTGPKDSPNLVASSLFADVLVSLGQTAIGQFNPGGIGGANGTQGRFEAGSRVNPWDYILMIEGTLLFAGAVARRMGSTAGSRAIFPFSVESIAVGYGSATASEETTDGSRAELWLPLWDTPTSLAEARYLFAEGRAQLGRRQARNSVEFALAANLLGISRGVSSFSRYGFLKRNGLAFLAAPLGRVPVQPRPQARLLDDPILTEWLDRWRRATSDKDRTPARYQSALRQIDRAIFEFACRSDKIADEPSNDAKWLNNVLRALGNAEQTLSKGLRFAQDKYLRPLQRLPIDWFENADDGSVEFRLAAALAGIGAAKNVVGPLRVFMEEVEVKGAGANWSPGSCSAVWSRRSLESNLAGIFQRRQLEAFQSGSREKGVPLSSPCPASLGDVVSFLYGETDDEKLADLLWALIGIDWSPGNLLFKPRRREKFDGGIPFEFGVARLVVKPLPLAVTGKHWRLVEGVEPTTPDPVVFHELASGRPDAVSTAVTRAARRLKSDGRIVAGYRSRLRSGQPLSVTSTIAPERLLAAMLVPLSDHDLSRIADSVLSLPETKE